MRLFGSRVFSGIILELIRLRTDRKTHKMFENAVEYFELKKVIGAFAPTLFNIIKEGY